MEKITKLFLNGKTYDLGGGGGGEPGERVPNVDIIGTPTIVEGNISDFSSENYLIAPFLSSFSRQPFMLHTSFTTSEDVNTQQNIVDSTCGLAFAIRNGRFVVALSTNGESRDMGEFVGGHSVQPETSYDVELEWTGNSFDLYYSLDGAVYSQDLGVGLNTPLSGKPLYFGGHGSSDHPYLGTFNFNDWFFKSNGNIVWIGMDSAYQTIRANISLSNLDEDGENRVLPREGNSEDVLVKNGEKSEWRRLSTINGQSLMGGGDIWVGGGGGSQVELTDEYEYDERGTEKYSNNVFYIVCKE